MAPAIDNNNNNNIEQDDETEEGEVSDDGAAPVALPDDADNDGDESGEVLDPCNVVAI
jgi:hypothetical protein